MLPWAKRTVMILTIDIGNTNIGWGVFEGDQLKATWRTGTLREKVGDEWGLQASQFFSHFGLAMSKVKRIAISNVVPPLSFAFQEMGRRFFNLEALFAGESLKIPMPILTDQPGEVGADLLVGAFAGHKTYGGPLIVVDFGTATTLSAVSQKGEFVGTSIAPGIAISAEALFAKAAKLPRIQFSKPPSAIGKNTIHSMQAGFLYGFVGQVEKIIRMMQRDLGAKAKVIATGGLADFIARETPEISKVDENLILHGLRLLCEQRSS